MSNTVFITKLDEFIKRIQFIYEDGVNLKPLLLESIYTQLATEANETIKSRIDLEVKSLFNESQYVAPWKHHTTMTMPQCMFCEDITLQCVRMQSQIDELKIERDYFKKVAEENAKAAVDAQKMNNNHAGLVL